MKNDTRNEGFLSIIETDPKSTIEAVIVASVTPRDVACDCYDCDFNCEECDDS